MRSDLLPFVLPVLLLLIVAELAWDRRGGHGAYDRKDAAANVGILVGYQASKALLLGWSVLLLGAAQGLTPLALPETAPVALLTFLASDFVYYWQHRLSHEVKALWVMHQTHHSSPWMNLTTSFRLNWMAPLIGPFFLVPLVLLGLPSRFVLASLGLNLVFQFFLHTQAIQRVPLLEGIVATPAAHRVHHASNARYLDKNFGGVLMLWDHLFGTWAEEETAEPPRYGITTGFQGHNPLQLVFGALVEYTRGTLNSRG